jgi:hypothetical protein
MLALHVSVVCQGVLVHFDLSRRFGIHLALPSCGEAGLRRPFIATRGRRAVATAALICAGFSAVPAQATLPPIPSIVVHTTGSANVLSIAPLNGYALAVVDHTPLINGEVVITRPRGTLRCVASGVCEFTVAAPPTVGSEEYEFRAVSGVFFHLARFSVIVSNWSPAWNPTTRETLIGGERISVTADDPDRDALALSVTAPPTEGSVTCDNLGCTYTAPVRTVPVVDAFVVTATDVFGATAVKTYRFRTLPKPQDPPCADLVGTRRAACLRNRTLRASLAVCTEKDDVGARAACIRNAKLRAELSRCRTLEAERKAPCARAARLRAEKARCATLESDKRAECLSVAREKYGSR